VVGCVTSVAGDGKCGPGALSAAFSKAITPWTVPLGENNLIAGTIVSSVVGGTASVLGGGKFANGAQTAAFSYLFNAMSSAARQRWIAAGAAAGGLLAGAGAFGCTLTTAGACAPSFTLIGAGAVGGGFVGNGIADVLDSLMFSEGAGGEAVAGPELAASSSGQRPSKTPNTGTPGSTVINPGSGQERTYGPDGKPLVDIDWDHDHGQGVPHRHDWVNGIRGPGIPVEKPKPKR
jgi:hypothetical protein